MTTFPSYKTSETALREIFEAYTRHENDETIALSDLQQISLDYGFPVSSSQISSFFKSPHINFIEFAQFVRHQEITMKRLFHIFDEYEDDKKITIQDISEQINKFNEWHYFWKIDELWVNRIFKAVNQRRDSRIEPNTPISYIEFRRQALLRSTPSMQQYYKATKRRKSGKSQSISQPIQRTQNQNQNQTQSQQQSQRMSGRELRVMFNNLSQGKGYIDTKTLFNAVKESKIPVSEHQLLQFFYRCDLAEDGKIDFIEFCEFIREEEQAIHELFKSLDLNKTGTLTVNDIRAGFHRKYLRDHHMTGIDNNFRSDLQDIDQWVNSIVERISSDQQIDKTDINNANIKYEDFLSYAILSGARNLSSITQPFSPNIDFEFIEDVYIPIQSDVISKTIINQNTFNTFISGIFAGIISRTMTAPIDRVKLFMQFKSHGSVGSHVNHIMSEGFLSFWRGNLTNCIKMAPETAIKFSTHQIIVRFLNRNRYRNQQRNEVRVKKKSYVNFIGGACAGVISQTCIYPLEIAKTRLALSKPGQYRNFIDCIYQCYKYESFGSLYNGWNASVIGIVPYCAIEMGVFFSLKDLYKHRFKTDPDMAILFGMGGIASISGAMVAYPLQLCRTKLQTQGMPGFPVIYKGLFDCFKQTFNKFGIFGLYSGMGPNLAKSIPATCISYFVVEKTKRFLKNLSGHKRYQY